MGSAVIEFSNACSLLVISAAFGTLWWSTRRQLRAATAARDAVAQSQASLSSILETIPIVAFRFADATGATADGYTEFLAGLEAGDAARLEAARLELQRGSIEFSAAAVTLEGSAYRIEGRRAASGESILWLLAEQAAAPRQRSDAAGRPPGLGEIIDALPMPVWRRDGTGTIVECNRAYASALGVAREPLPDRWPELLPRQPEGGAAAGASVPDRHLVGHAVVDGSRRLLEVTEMAHRGGGVIGFAVDRTDAEIAQTELWRHINAHGEVLESIHAGVAIYGANQRLRYFNGAFSALWGIGEDWLAGEPTLGEVLEWLRERRRIPEHSDFRAYKRERLAMFTGLIEPRREMMHLPDGRTLQLSVSPHPLGGLVFLYEDVTDRLALECSFNTLLQVQRATLDHLFEGIAVFGADGRLKLQNPAYRAIWELSEEDVAGEPHVEEIAEKMRALLDDGDWATTKQAVIQRVSTQVPTNGLVSRRDGSLLQAATVPLPDGEVLLTYLDVSDSARVEQALREKNEALETADRLKSEFIANISYELRTPLNAVIGFSEILTNQYFGTLNARQLDYARSIFDSAHQLMALINDILDLATIEAGYLVLERDRVDVPKMLKAVAALTEERARSRGLRFVLSCSPDVGIIDADERRLKQALFNLISNAIKFTPPGGCVGIEAEHRGGDLLLLVTDNGSGIAPVEQARIFEKFEPGARRSGAGLGLALVTKLIELHNGTVSIESAPEHGTRIMCRLPAARRTRRRPARRKANAPNLGGTAQPARSAVGDPPDSIECPEPRLSPTN